mgnify:CR=1 FL=1
MEEMAFVNNSGQGKDSVVPAEVKGYSWGAFTLSWIWGIFNNSWFTMFAFLGAILSLIPFIGWLIPWALCIWFGFRGNEWAWQNKKWESIEKFHEIQKKWAIASAICFGVLVVLAFIGIILALTIPSLLTKTQEQQFETMKKKGRHSMCRPFLKFYDK